MPRTARLVVARGVNPRIRYLVAVLVFAGLTGSAPRTVVAHSAGTGSGAPAHGQPAAAPVAGSVVASALAEPCGTCETPDLQVCQDTFQTQDCHQFEYDLGDDDRGMDIHSMLSNGNVGGPGLCGGFHPSCDGGLRLGELQHAAEQGDRRGFDAALGRNPAAFARLDAAAGLVVVYAPCSSDSAPELVARLPISAAFTESWQQVEQASTASSR
jgi:hypothetical protein